MSRSPKDVLDKLRGEGHRLTAQRRAIVHAIMSMRGHITPQAVARRVKRKVEGVNDSTIYRTLELLEQHGFVAHVHLGGGAQYHLAEEGDHAHLVCEVCGTEEDLTLEETEPLRRAIKRSRGFSPDFTHFAISGLCARCSTEALGDGGR